MKNFKHLKEIRNTGETLEKHSRNITENIRENMTENITENIDENST